MPSFNSVTKPILEGTFMNKQVRKVFLELRAKLQGMQKYFPHSIRRQTLK